MTLPDEDEQFCGGNSKQHDQELGTNQLCIKENYEMLLSEELSDVDLIPSNVGAPKLKNINRTRWSEEEK